jgi:hypothetical protein
MSPIFVIFKKLPKVINRPWSENSPNLVTLTRYLHMYTEIIFVLNKQCLNEF